MSERKYPTYPTKIKIAADHGGRCALCGPESPVLYPNLKGEQINGIRVGIFAHIHSESGNGPRYDPTLTEDKLSNRFNFLYVCGDHHNLIDENVKDYDAGYLQKLRKTHVELIQNRLSGSKKSLKTAIIILEDNQFGKIDRSSILESLNVNNIPIIDLNISLKLPPQDHLINWLKACSIVKTQWKDFQEIFFSKNANEPLIVIPDEYHIFSITKIPIAIYFGALIQETNKNFLHQWRRQEKTWIWHQNKKYDDNSMNINISRPINMNFIENGSIILKVEISASIKNDYIKELDLPLNNLYRLSVQNPSKYWLQTQKQLKLICNEFRTIFDEINSINEEFDIHLFYAGPTPLAIFIGQIYNPRMDHPLFIYNWQRSPNNKLEYVQVLELGNQLNVI